jgi:hypothetical protein
MELSCYHAETESMSELGETVTETIHEHEHGHSSGLGSTVALLVALAATFIALVGVRTASHANGPGAGQTIRYLELLPGEGMKQNRGGDARELGAPRPRHPGRLERRQADRERRSSLHYEREGAR